MTKFCAKNSGCTCASLTELTGDSDVGGGLGRFTDADGIVGTHSELIGQTRFKVTDDLGGVGDVGNSKMPQVCP